MGQANNKLAAMTAALKKINELLDAGAVTAAQEVAQAALGLRAPVEPAPVEGSRSYALFDRDFRHLCARADVAAAYLLFEPQGSQFAVYSGGNPDVHRYLTKQLRLERRRPDVDDEPADAPVPAPVPDNHDTVET